MVRRSGNVVRQCGCLTYHLSSRTPRAISDRLVHVVGEMVGYNPLMMVATVVYIVLPNNVVSIKMHLPG